MTTPMRTSLTAIGRRLQAEYLPTLSRPLPGELQDLVAQLVALEAGKQKHSTETTYSLSCDESELVQHHLP
jgi:hypothetical protein